MLSELLLLHCCDGGLLAAAAMSAAALCNKPCASSCPYPCMQRLSLARRAGHAARDHCGAGSQGQAHPGEAAGLLSGCIQAHQLGANFCPLLPRSSIGRQPKCLAAASTDPCAPGALATTSGLAVLPICLQGICGGMGQITKAYNGTYPSLLDMSNFDPYTSACAQGSKGGHVALWACGACMHAASPNCCACCLTHPTSIPPRSAVRHRQHQHQCGSKGGHQRQLGAAAAGLHPHKPHAH